MSAPLIVTLLALLLGIQPITTDLYLPALAGFILAAGAVLICAWLGVSMDGTVYPMTLTIGAISVCTALVAWTLVQRHGEAR